MILRWEVRLLYVFGCGGSITKRLITKMYSFSFDRATGRVERLGLRAVATVRDTAQSTPRRRCERCAGADVCRACPMMLHLTVERVSAPLVLAVAASPRRSRE